MADSRLHRGWWRPSSTCKVCWPLAARPVWQARPWVTLEMKHKMFHNEMAEHESGMKVASVEDKWTQGRPPKHYGPWSRGQDWDIQMCYSWLNPLKERGHGRALNYSTTFSLNHIGPLKNVFDLVFLPRLLSYFIITTHVWGEPWLQWGLCDV